MNDPIIRRLESLGEARAPELFESHVRTLEERVMAAGPAPIDKPVGRRRAMPMLLSAAAALLIAVVAFGALGGGRNGLTVSAAEGVVVELPDGSSAAVSAGDDVPDGAIIDVAIDGEVVVDGQRFGSGRYLVVDGRLLPEPVSSTTSTTTTDPRSPTTAPLAVTPGSPPGIDPPPTTEIVPITRPIDSTVDRSRTTVGRSTIVDGTTTPPTTTTTTTIRNRPDRTTTTTPATTTVSPTTTASIPSDRSFDTRPEGG
jgi:hypothetical protein